ncbi:hypothetical protein [Myroides fluvii]|uniref:hypothetical protein n=1 Tax=Myroides fluvii TaxID=2572594 RepID=UPI00131E8223|nr:hypothetical protein [Myroides fluvii]
MKTLLLSILFVCTSLASYAQFGLNVYDGLTAKAIINFKNGTREVGTVKENSPLFKVRSNDPDEIKFKNDGAADYRLVSSSDFTSILVDVGKKEVIYKEYFPIRIRQLKNKDTFSDKYFVDYYPLVKYKDLAFVQSHLFVNGKYANDFFLFPVANSDYYFLVDDGIKKKKKLAQTLMKLDPDCEEFRVYIQKNYLDASNYKEEYKQAVNAFKANQSNFIDAEMGKGKKRREAKYLYQSGENFIFIQQLLDKYLEFCGKEKK